MTDAVLTPDEVEALTRVPVETLKWWRKIGKGPVWFKVGMHPRYLESDVEAWLRDQRDAGQREIEERQARMAAG